MLCHNSYNNSVSEQRIKSLTVWWFPPRGGDDGDEEMCVLGLN